MKWIFKVCTLALFTASMGAPAEDFRIDFDHMKVSGQVSAVRGTGFRLQQIGVEHGRGSLALGVVDRPTSANPLDRAVEASEISEKYGQMKGRFLRIDGLGKTREVQLSFDKKARLVTFDYVLGNSVARTDAFEYTFTCDYSSGTTDRISVKVANSANLAERTRGKIECSAPENAYVRSILLSNATNGSYETWVDNIVGQDKFGNQNDGYLARRKR